MYRLSVSTLVFGASLLLSSATSAGFPPVGTPTCTSAGGELSCSRKTARLGTGARVLHAFSRRTKTRSLTRRRVLVCDRGGVPILAVEPAFSVFQGRPGKATRQRGPPRWSSAALELTAQEMQLTPWGQAQKSSQRLRPLPYTPSASNMLPPASSPAFVLVAPSAETRPRSRRAREEMGAACCSVTTPARAAERMPPRVQMERRSPGISPPPGETACIPS